MKSKALVALFACLGLLATACGGSSSGYEFIEPATIEPIDGSELSRISLTEAAVERLGVTIAEVGFESVARMRLFGAQVVARPAQAGAGGGLWLRLVLTESEENSVVLGLGGSLSSHKGESQADGLTAQLADGISDEDGADDVHFFEVADGPGVAVGTALLIELQTTETDRLIVPYSAVVYDPGGQTWVYANPSPLVYQRESITVAYIEGDQAFLEDGPPPGTAIVAIGAGELSGFEAGIGR